MIGNPIVWALSGLSLSVAVAAVYYVIFFIVLFAIFWGVLLVFKAIKSLFTFSI